MNKAELQARLTDTDEFVITFYGKTKQRQFFQGTVTPGKTEPQITPEQVVRLQAKYGADTVVVYDRTNEKLVAVKPQNVSRVDALATVVGNG